MFKEGTKSPLFVYGIMELTGKIQDLAAQHLIGTSHFVLHVKVLDRLKPAKITIIVDGDDGITIDDCARLSRSLTDSINETSLLDDYNLEVTTPGVDQPLKLLRQYKKHVGRNVKIDLKENEVVRGKLISIEGEVVVVEEEKKGQSKKSEKITKSINFNQIDKTFVMISFK